MAHPCRPGPCPRLRLSLLWGLLAGVATLAASRTGAAQPAGAAPPPADAIAEPAPPPPDTPPASPDAPPPVPAPLPPEVEVPPAPGTTPPDESQVPPLDESEKKKKKKKNKHAKNQGDGSDGKGGDDADRAVRVGWGEARLGGWVFARGELARLERIDVDAAGGAATREVDSLDISIPSARLRVDYAAPWPWITGQLEVDLAGRPDLRDAYVQAKGHFVAARMGQFKVPVLAMQMESIWVLPMVRRGLIHDLTVDWLDVGGRRPGATVTFRGRVGDVKPRLTLGAFQASTLTELAVGARDTDLAREWSLSAQSLVARGQIDVGPVEIGASYLHRMAAPMIGQLRRFWTAGADVTLNDVYASGGLRVWVDGLAGASWYEHGAKPYDNQDATFVSTRALIAYRFGGTALAEPYIEPYVFGGVLDPDLDVSSDWVWEATAGVNVGLFGVARVTLQAELDRADRNFPASFLAGLDPDRSALIAQVGLAF